jgi:hypothetical protein
LDCGLNGECVGGACACRPAWAGARCQTLALLPASLGAGYRGIGAAGANLSSWGGAVLWSNETGRYHMFLSEFLNSCGLGTWTVNSQIVHATAAALDQPFRKAGAVVFGTASADAAAGPVQPHFAHEPVVTRGPGGEWVMYWTGCDPSAAAPSSTACRPAFAAGEGRPVDCRAPGDGSTPKGRLGKGTRPKSSDSAWMAWATRPGGPWSEPAVVMSPSLNNMTGAPARPQQSHSWLHASELPSFQWTLGTSLTELVGRARRARLEHVACDPGERQPRRPLAGERPRRRPAEQIGRDVVHPARDRARLAGPGHGPGPPGAVKRP